MTAAAKHQYLEKTLQIPVSMKDLWFCSRHASSDMPELSRAPGEQKQAVFAVGTSEQQSKVSPVWCREF